MPVPESVRDSPFLEEIFDVEDSGLLKGYETRMLRTPKALAKICASAARFLATPIQFREGTFEPTPSSLVKCMEWDSSTTICTVFDDTEASCEGRC